MKIAVTGSTSITNKIFLEDIMKQYPEPSLIISGGAVGADSLVESYAKEKGITLLTHFAKLKPNGVYDNGAVFKRNVKIVSDAELALVLWDGDSTGPQNTISLCIAKKIPCKVFVEGLPTKAPFKKDVCGFVDKAQWLSNYWISDVKVQDNVFPSAQNAYFAAAYWRNPELVEQFTKVTPMEASVLARELYKTHSSDYDPEFKDRRDDIMKRIVERKFVQNPYLKCKLMLSEDFNLQHTNTWDDTHFGVCNGEGKNLLGTILMELREKFLKDESTS
jgi:hypothetical protein